MTDLSDKQASLAAVLQRSPVVPVVVIHDLAQAVPAARALLAGGIDVIEVTLRTPAALDAMKAIASHVPGIAVGAGTVRTPTDLENAREAGASFAVSPGATDALLDHADANNLPVLPGAATASEVMALLERGYELLKLFPAAAVGGAGLLRSLAGPLPQARFCPTGGITVQNAGEYLALPNVVCVGGSWLTPKALLARGDWKGIESLAREASVLR